MTSVVTGISSAGSTATAGVAKGIAAMTFDEEFMDTRQRRQQSKASNMGDAMAQGTEALLSGAVEGASSLLVMPVQEARKDGYKGLVKGIGKGFVGTFTKPM